MVSWAAKNESQMAMVNVQYHYTTPTGVWQVKKNETTEKQRIEDQMHMYAGWVLLKEALDEFYKVRNKDNIMAHAVNVIGATMDTIYEYIPRRRAS